MTKKEEDHKDMSTPATELKLTPQQVALLRASGSVKIGLGIKTDIQKDCQEIRRGS